MSEAIPRGVAKVFLWPAFVVAYFMGPGPNIGTPENPVYEGTVIDPIILLNGLGLTAAFYSIAVYLLILCLRGRGSISTLGGMK